VITKIVLWLQKIALLFGISCTEINQSQSSNIFKYIIIVVQYFDTTMLSKTPFKYSRLVILDVPVFPAGSTRSRILHSSFESLQHNN
jgi:hypothetical protein